MSNQCFFLVRKYYLWYNIDMEKESIYRYKEIFKKVIDYILIILLFIVAIKKGGFYKSDVLFFNLAVTFIGTIYILTYFIYGILKNKAPPKLDIIQILLFIISLCYLLPILRGNYTNLSDAIFEMIRYFDIFLIYTIVLSSSNKKIYINGIILIVFVLCILGIDQISGRVFADILKEFNSGYLNSINITRMSSTIQYANVFGILCVMCVFLVLEKLGKCFIKKKYDIKFFLLIILLNTFLLCALLTKSRAIIIILILSIILYVTLKRKDFVFYFSILLPTLILVLVQVSIIANNMQYNTNIAYIVFLVSTLFIFITYFILYKLKIFEKINNLEIINIKKGCKIIIPLLFIFLVLSISIRIPIRLSSTSNDNKVSRNIYLSEKKENKIDIKIKQNETDSRYSIEVIAVDKNYNSEIIQTFYYYTNTNDTFSFNFTPKDDFNYLMINIICTKGSIDIEKITVNDKESYIDYLLLPSEIVFRLNDTLKTNLSNKDRFSFYKDSIKISTLNLNNFLFGLGGDAFKNINELYKTQNYSSTEVHNVYLQMLLEAGIFCVLVFLICLFLCIKKSKNNIFKYILVVFLIHFVMDLDFSFMFFMAVFAVILALLDIKKIYNLKNKIVCYIMYITFAITGTVLCVILFRANVAYYMKIPKYSKENITIKNQLEVVEKNEKRVKLDTFEVVYKKALIEEYNTYMTLITSVEKENLNENSKNMLNEELNIVLSNVKVNLEDIKKYDKYSFESLNYVNSEILKCLSIKDNMDNKMSEDYLNLLYINLNDMQIFRKNTSYKEILNENIKSYISGLENINISDDLKNSYIEKINTLIY